MKTEFKNVGFEFELKAEGDAMTIEGYGSTFGGEPDAYGDIIAKGAFKESLKTIGLPKMLYQHHQHRVCGIWDEAKEDSKGLFLKGHFINTTLGRDAYEEVRSGAIDKMSIGFSTLDFDTDAKKGIRTLKAVNLYEVSLVTFPANANASVTGVKTVPTTIRELEELLRDAGFSRQQAKAIASDGFKAMDAQREAVDDLTPYHDFFSTIHSSLNR